MGAPFPSGREGRRRYRPMLATPAQVLPAGGGWLFEPKWDGYRCIAYVRAGKAELHSRSGRVDLTDRFRPLAEALPAAVGERDCVLDGEVCALDEAGRARFSLLQQGRGRLVYQVFDLLEKEGDPLLARPLRERRRLLARPLDPRSTAVRLTPAARDGRALLQAARRREVEGVVAKRADSPYEEGRSRSWLKVKVRPRQEVVVVGYTRGKGRRERLGSLLVAVPAPGRLRFAGSVGTGLSEEAVEVVYLMLECS